MKTKLELAHDWAMRNYGQFNTEKDLAKFAWKYADAMYAELEKRESKERPTVLQEWHPDWSEAPEFAKYWAMDKNKRCHWYAGEIIIECHQWVASEECDHDEFKYWKSPSFNYTGNWQESLRERP